MKLHCSGKQVINELSGDNSILDSSIIKIEISALDGEACVKIDLSMRRSSSFKTIRLCFNNCSCYDFSYSKEYDFYNVESAKLLDLGNEGFYVSFDPFDEEDFVNQQDQDFVASTDLSMFVIN